MDRPIVTDTVRVDDVDVHFVDVGAPTNSDVVGAPRTHRSGDASGGPTLLTQWKGVEVDDVDLDDLLGPSYESLARRPLRDWTDLPAGDAADGYHEVGVGDIAPFASSSSAGGDGEDISPSVLPFSFMGANGSVTNGDDASGGEENNEKPYEAGKGRARGGAFDARAELEDILVVLFCRQMIAPLRLRDGIDEESERLIKWTINALVKKRASYTRLSNKVLSTKAWTLRRSGCIGAVVQFKEKGTLNNTLQDCSLAIEASLSDDNEAVVCCSRAAENFLVTGCQQREVVVRALKEVQACTRIALVDEIGTLAEDLRISVMNQGIAVLYGKRLCVVRREGGSLPLAAVRRKRDGTWICHACL